MNASTTTNKSEIPMIAIYNNNTYRFVSFGGGNTVTVAKGGKFYNLPVQQVQLIRTNQ
jgi:hypothetical protein